MSEFRISSLTLAFVGTLAALFGVATDVLLRPAVANHSGIARQTLAHYEVGRLRLPVALVPKLAELFAVSADVFRGVASARARTSTGKRGPSPKLQRQLERVSRLLKAQQDVILARLDGVRLQHG